MDKCNSCYYNFDGICANHCNFKFPAISYYDIDPYGFDCSEMLKKENSDCDGYREQPFFLVEQER